MDVGSLAKLSWNTEAIALAEQRLQAMLATLHVGTDPKLHFFVDDRNAETGQLKASATRRELLACLLAPARRWTALQQVLREVPTVERSRRPRLVDQVRVAGGGVR